MKPKPPAIDWAAYTLKAEIVARETSVLRPFRFVSFQVPPLDSDDLAMLTQSVQANGVQEPLTITADGEVVDGNARLLAAQQAGIHQVPTRILESRGGEAEYALWAAAVNIARRHLTPSQRVFLAKAMLSVLERRARQRQEATRFGHTAETAPSEKLESVRANLDSPAASSDVRSQLGALMGVSRSQAAKVVNVIKHGSEELQHAVASGQTSIHRAHKVVHARPTAHQARTKVRREGRAQSHARTDEPVRTVRLTAGLITEWVDQSRVWDGARRREFLCALRNLMDSCELAFRRLSTPAERG
jgi:ParB-like chromosome segregation protein Spo0J